LKHIHLPTGFIDNANSSEPAEGGRRKFYATRRRGTAALPPDLTAGEQSGGNAPPPVLALDMHGLLAAVPVSRTFIYEEVKKGNLIATKLGRRILFRIRDVEAWLGRQ
jgi:excisionase family DNA binding protein